MVVREVHGDAVGGTEAPLPARRGTSSDDAVIFFTSGTTGDPKGVVHTHAGLLRTLQALEATRSADQHRWLTPLAFHTIGGHTIVYRVLLQGDCLVLMRDFHPRRLLQLVSDEQVSAIGIAPAMVDLLLRVSRRDRFDLSSLEIVGVGSSPLPPSLAHAASTAFGAMVVNTYGSTELGGPVLMAVPDAPDEFVLLSAAEARIVSPDGKECGVEEPGKLSAASRHLALRSGRGRDHGPDLARLVPHGGPRDAHRRGEDPTARAGR